MTPLERQAITALEHCSMRIASSGKRFRNQMSWHLEHDSEFKMTAAQARYLWLLVDMYRRQIKDEDLRSFGAHVKLTGEFPDIYLPGDHREGVAAKNTTAGRVAMKPPKPSRYQIELERGGGRLAL